METTAIFTQSDPFLATLPDAINAASLDQEFSTRSRDANFPLNLAKTPLDDDEDADDEDEEDDDDDDDLEDDDDDLDEDDDEDFEDDENEDDEDEDDEDLEDDDDPKPLRVKSRL